jgi:lipoprotein-anchoring transpeptidase ErfK/SrfK
MARLSRLGYHNAAEKLAERFHISEPLSQRLNPGIGFRKAGTKLLVPDIGRGDLGAAIAAVEVDKEARVLRALDPSGKALAVYPASIGSDEKPAPSGQAEVASSKFVAPAAATTQQKTSRLLSVNAI